MSGTIPRACTKVSGANVASALQINKRGSLSESDDYCYVVGKYDQGFIFIILGEIKCLNQSAFLFSVSTKVSLLDSQDPTKGIQLQYVGDYCESSDQRQFNIQMICADKMNPVPTHGKLLTLQLLFQVVYCEIINKSVGVITLPIYDYYSVYLRLSSGMSGFKSTIMWWKRPVCIRLR